MDRLIAGYRRFRAETWPVERARYEELSKAGQSPETLVISCSDSRVDPQRVFGAGPGELFVVRNVAGLVPPYTADSNHHGTSAAIEYAVRVLKVARIVVLGHAQCGGVQAMVDGTPREARDFVETWMKLAAPVLDHVPHGLSHEEKLTHCEEEVVRLSLSNLMTFPWIAEKVEAGEIALRGFRFAVKTGILEQMDETGFHPVE